MPNWCDCDLRVYIGQYKQAKKSKLLKEFKEFAKTKKKLLDENKFIPYPEKYREMDKRARKLGEFGGVTKKGEEIRDGFNNGGYEWCYENWGTKWGIVDAQLLDEQLDYTLFYNFRCAWAPPLPVILKMSEMFPKLRFELRYFECGMGFNGLYVCVAGKVVENEEGKYYGDRGG